jgi:hypothetical protein
VADEMLQAFLTTAPEESEAANYGRLG